MRVLLTTDTVGGVWTFTRELAEGLLQDDNTAVSLIALGGEAKADQTAWLDDMHRQHRDRFRSTVAPLPLEWRQDNAEAFSAAGPRVMREIEAFGPDVLHLNQFCLGALETSLPKVVTAHSDVLSWFRAVRGSGPEPSGWLRNYTHLVQDGLAGATIVTAPTRAALDDLQRGFGPMPNTRVIANGIAFPVPSAREKKLQAITAGRLWDEAKNIRLLEEVRTSVPLLVAGPANDENAQYRPAQSAGSITLLGALAYCTLLQRFAECAIYIATSVYEPFGLAAVEAARCGCAVLTTDIPSLREVWGDAAIYFRTADELSRALDALAADPAALRRAQQHSTARSAEFTRGRMVQQYRECYSAADAQALATGGAHA